MVQGMILEPDSRTHIDEQERNVIDAECQRTKEEGVVTTWVLCCSDEACSDLLLMAQR